MGSIVVSGLVNIETTLRVDSFPVDYVPVRYPFFGIGNMVSGVGFNIAKALKVLGNDVELLSLLGRDVSGKVARQSLAEAGLDSDYVIADLEHTPHSVILYDGSGRRQIHVDLKAIQEKEYPLVLFERAIENCSLAILCNINFSRPLLRLAQQAGKPIATDVHTISDLDDAYNQAFMRMADILFMSDERLPVAPEAWVRKLQNRFAAEIIVIGLGDQGALLAVRSDGFLERCSAAHTRPVVNTIGAGDALFSAFNHFYIRTGDPYQSIQKAILFASYKIGESGASEGFLTAADLERLAERTS